MNLPDTLTIRFGEDYRCELVLAQLHALTVKNWRKLCRLMSSDIFQNEATWGQFAVWFPVAIENAKADRTHAPWGEKTRTKQRKAYYAKLLADADRRVRKLEKFYSIFKGEM